MRFKSLFILLIKRFFTKRNMALTAVLVIALLFGVHKGAIDNKRIINDSLEFKKVEGILFDTISNYVEYSERGVSVFFIPPASGVFFGSPAIFSQLSGKVNSIIDLNIYNNCKSRAVLGGNSPLQWRFSVLVLLFGSITSLLLGVEATFRREFLKTLTCDSSHLAVFLSLVFSRIILIILFFLSAAGLGLLLLVIEGIPLSSALIVKLGIYMVPAFIMVTFFFVIGTILGSLEKKFNRNAGILSIWILFVFIYPMIIDTVREEKALEIPSSYHLDNNKLQIVNDFEKRFIDERGGARNYSKEEAREIIEDYWNNIFPLVEKVDEDLKAKIDSLADDYMDTAILVPTTFYNSTAHELSGRGYGAYLDFYTHLQRLRREFLRFWLDRVYYHDAKILKNFVTGDENLFHSRGYLPRKFLKGIFINLGIIIALGILSFYLFKRSLYSMTREKTAKLAKMEMKLKPGELTVMLIKNETLNNALFTVFSGETSRLKKNGFKGEILVNGSDMTAEKIKGKFLYICRPSKYPSDITVKDLLQFYRGWRGRPPGDTTSLFNGTPLEPIINKTLSQLEDHEAFEVVFALFRMPAGDISIYLLDDLTSWLSTDFAVRLKEEIERLTARGIMVIYLTAPHMLEHKAIKAGNCFGDGKAWGYMVESEKSSLIFKEALEQDEKS